MGAILPFVTASGHVACTVKMAQMAGSHGSRPTLTDGWHAWKNMNRGHVRCIMPSGRIPDGAKENGFPPAREGFVLCETSKPGISTYASGCRSFYIIEDCRCKISRSAVNSYLTNNILHYFSYYRA
jgi:hypothetical protein